jgi:hypothetical protein
MSQRITLRIWAILGMGIATIAGLVLLLAFLGRKPSEPAPMITPVIPTPSDDPVDEEFESPIVPYIPIAQSPLATVATSPIPTPVPATATPPPTPNLAVPDVALDFTLERAGGGTLALAEQLAQGPVVLVFFQRGG